MELEDVLGDNRETVFENNDISRLAWFMWELFTRLMDEIKLTQSTWETLMEDPDFRKKSRKSQKIIWELTKIRENDSPKNQVDVAKQYGVTDAHVSQLAEYFEP